MPTLFRRRAVIAVGAAAAALVGLAARPANAAAIPGWRISATFPVHGKDAVLTSAAVVGPRDAWAAGPLLTLAGAESGLIIRHWDGRSWTTVALPARIARAWRLSHPVGLLVGASDARHVWIFGGQADGAYLRLTGTRWSLGHLPGSFLAGRDVQINAVAAIGKSNVWALGATDNRGVIAPYAAHFNGARWTVPRVPGKGGIVSVSVASTASIWAVTGTSPQANAEGPARTAGPSAVLHWGRSGGWRRAVQPGLPAGSDLSSVLVRSGRVIAGGSAPNGRTGRTPFLVSWNGSAWSGPLGPGASPTNWQVGDVAPDGHGGTWVLGIRGDTGPGPNPARLWHVVAGRWYPVQPKFGKHVWWLLLQITAVPHTDSVWGAGYLLTGRTAAGLMALAGPAPR